MKSVPVPVVAAGVAILVLIVLFFGWRMLNPDSKPTNVGSDGKKIDIDNPSLLKKGTPESPGSAKAMDAQ